jgi:hypothetical protein
VDPTVIQSRVEWRSTSSHLSTDRNFDVTVNLPGEASSVGATAED